MQPHNPDAAQTDAAILAFPPSPERRLRVALRHLDQALAEQREAVAAFRTQLSALKGAMAGLGESAIDLRERLESVSEDASRAQAAAAALLATAESLPD